jgi:hypothetical protein
MTHEPENSDPSTVAGKPMDNSEGSGRSRWREGGGRGEHAFFWLKRDAAPGVDGLAWGSTSSTSKLTC